MKKLLLLVLLNIAVIFSYGQSARQSNDNSVIGGSFYYNVTTKGVKQQININYALFHLPFHDAFTMMLHTANDLELTTKVVNSAGAVVIKWKPEKVNYRYEHEFNISALPTGKYRMDIYAENGSNKIYSIPFNKE